ncbi:serine/threonine-protein kinase [Pleurocapsa sp. PCC 7319]|uniref:serine/threonine-protein kinase n=1 Tax=Pleurocapsa sp. PCC 7319 TaxID=118161 RepID=UPI000344B9FB|nr:serine/threonine-protein kinase [Pleurocapsa sp. PCC 7319]
MSENLVGKKLRERYDLQKNLGSGGFGTIYLAKDTTTAIGGTYVVKHFSPSYTNEAQLVTGMRLFRQEAASLQKLGKHSQIPNIIDFFEEDNNFFLIQEFIEGQNLDQELAEVKYFDQSQTIKLLTDTLEVLKFIHQAGYIHRDIKPSNLIRNRFDNRFFVIDFGAVKEKINPQNIGVQGELVLTVGILSPGYTPDEQLHGRPEFCSDIYALGMVAIQALTGVHPRILLRNINLDLMWRDHLQLHLDYHPHFLDVIERMVKQKWQQRYQSAISVLEDLNKMNLLQISVSAIPTKQPTLSAVSDIQVQETSFSPIQFSKNSNLIKYLSGSGILVLIAIPLFLLLSNSRLGKFITYENKFIKVDYPQGWSRVDQSNFLNTSVSFISPHESSSDRFRERVTVVMKNSSRPLSLTQYTNQAVAQIESLSNFILAPPRPTNLGRSEAKYVIYQGKDKNIDVKRHEVWTVNYDQIYSIIYTAEPDRFNKFLPRAEKIIESLEIKN